MKLLLTEALCRKFKFRVFGAWLFRGILYNILAIQVKGATLQTGCPGGLVEKSAQNVAQTIFCQNKYIHNL
jgi:hypothetical protein